MPRLELRNLAFAPAMEAATLGLVRLDAKEGVASIISMVTTYSNSTHSTLSKLAACGVSALAPMMSLAFWRVSLFTGKSP
jgi:hypothetical protein